MLLASLLSDQLSVFHLTADPSQDVLLCAFFQEVSFVSSPMSFKGLGIQRASPH